MATKAQKATTQSESPQQQTLPMQYDVRIHSLRLDGNCRAHASVNINGCFAIRGVKVMESSKGLFVSMPSYRAGNGEYHSPSSMLPHGPALKSTALPHQHQSAKLPSPWLPFFPLVLPFSMFWRL